MKLARDAIEYVKWPVTGAPEDATFAVQFSTDDTGTWHDLERTGNELRILLAGPAAVDSAAAYTLPLDRTMTRIRCVDNPETPIRSGGPIDVG